LFVIIFHEKSILFCDIKWNLFAYEIFLAIIKINAVTGALKN